MTPEWDSHPLGDLLSNLIDHRGRTPKKLGGDFVDSGVRVISAKNLKSGGLDLAVNPRFVTDEMWDRWMPTKLEVGDVLLTSEAPLGQAAFLKTDSRYCLGQRLFGLRADPTQLDGRFLYYNLISPVTQARLQVRASGTTAQGIRQSELVKVLIDVPPTIEEQRRIAWVLGSLDDKIELNKRMARTLEDIAATIFRARFIDFEGIEEFEDSELGPIPKGWRWGELDEIVTNTNDREAAGEEGGDTPYIGLDVMPRGSTVLWSWDARSKVTGETRKFSPGDILFGKLRPYFKKVAMAPVVGSCSTEILVLRSRENYWPVALGHLTDDRFIEYCVAHSRGTKMPRSEWKDMKAYPVAIPPAEVAEELGSPIQVIGQQAISLIHETRTLSSLRDELLSRLISGQIRVPEGVGPDADEVEVAEELAGV